MDFAALTLADIASNGDLLVPDGQLLSPVGSPLALRGSLQTPVRALAEIGVPDDGGSPKHGSSATALQAKCMVLSEEIRVLQERLLASDSRADELARAMRDQTGQFKKQ